MSTETPSSGAQEENFSHNISEKDDTYEIITVGKAKISINKAVLVRDNSKLECQTAKFAETSTDYWNSRAQLTWN